MEQGPKAREREPEKVKADVNPAKAAEDPAQIPAPDQEKDKEEGRADKAGTRVVIEEIISSIYMTGRSLFNKTI